MFSLNSRSYGNDYDKYRERWKSHYGVKLEKYVYKNISNDLAGSSFGMISTRVPDSGKIYSGRYGEAFVGKDTRIDDFLVISLGDEKSVIGAFVHIAPFCLISGKNGFIIGDFSGLSAGVKIYTASADYSGRAISHPPTPKAFRRPQEGPVIIGRHCILGANTVVLPGVTIPDGVAVGANSLVNETLDPWMIYAGNPVKAIGERLKGCLEKEAQFIQTL